MGFIKCSECSAEISDIASYCPKCGAPATVNSNDKDYNGGVAIPAFVTKNKIKTNLLILISILLFVITVIIIIGIALEDSHSNNKGRIKQGIYCDAYDDDGDGWVDRVYDRDLGQWWEHQFQPGEFSMDDAG